MTSTTLAAGGAIPLVKSPSLWRVAWRRLLRNRWAAASLFYILFVFLIGILAPVLPVTSYSKQDLSRARQFPSLSAPLGTDDFGRDMLSRMVWGAQTAVLVATIPTAIAMGVAVVIGCVAALVGGIADQVLMRMAEYVLAFPGLLLAIFLAATFKPLIINLVRDAGFRGLAATGIVDYMAILIILALLAWPGLSRIVRGQVLSLREREYIEAARALGATRWRIIMFHLLPNLATLLIVIGSGTMAGAIGSETLLSFLGIGIVPPYPSWGSMIASSYSYLRSEYWFLLLEPSFMVGSLLFAFIYLGDGLSDILNPQTR